MGKASSLQPENLDQLPTDKEIKEGCGQGTALSQREHGLA